MLLKWFGPILYWKIFFNFYQCDWTYFLQNHIYIYIHNGHKLINQSWVCSWFFTVDVAILRLFRHIYLHLKLTSETLRWNNITQKSAGVDVNQYYAFVCIIKMIVLDCIWTKIQRPAISKMYISYVIRQNTLFISRHNKKLRKFQDTIFYFLTYT